MALCGGFTKVPGDLSWNKQSKNRSQPEQNGEFKISVGGFSNFKLGESTTDQNNEIPLLR